ncbi:MAG: septum formation initiator family protein [Anaerolineae bacterium]|jgi:cell division protein FtsB
MKIPKLDRFRIALGAGILLVVVIVGGLGWAFLQQLTLAEELRGETRQLEQAVATQKARQAYLTATLTYVNTDAYVEEWAREEAKMAKPGEVVVIPVVKGASSKVESTPTPEASEAPPADEARPFWTVWWQALTGSRR